MTVENGPDFSADQVSHLVEPFSRGAAARLAGGGVSLGLTIVDTIACGCGGELALRACPGGGLAAELTLPAG